MSNPSQVTAPRPTVSDYGLVRRLLRPPHSRLDMGFIEQYMKRADIEKYRVSWVEYGIDTGDGGFTLASYSISTSLKAYVTEYVYLTLTDQAGSRRYTPMRFPDMMVDNYLAAGGDLKTWQYIGARNIVNDAVRALIQEGFQLAGSDFNRAGTVEFLPENPVFETTIMANPFMQGIRRILREYEQDMGKAKIKRVIFISLGRSGTHDIPDFHAVIELYRPGDEGYPQGQATEGVQTQRR
ncbi:hypothetical protein GGR51DRAFT_290997 [Nemania sp. FL0031]|nr:hypothetical protein GGR51DRAFT_290997 [Nemania sp. FL0031]